MSVHRTAPSSPSRLSARVLAGIILLTLTACSSKDAPVGTPVEAAAIPVRTAPSTSGPAGPSIGTNGLIASEDEMRLSFKTGGILQRIVVRERWEVDNGFITPSLKIKRNQVESFYHDVVHALSAKVDKVVWA